LSTRLNPTLRKLTPRRPLEYKCCLNCGNVSVIGRPDSDPFNIYPEELYLLCKAEKPAKIVAGVDSCNKFERRSRNLAVNDRIIKKMGADHQLETLAYLFCERME